jgi:hypothetical protein
MVVGPVLAFVVVASSCWVAYDAHNYDWSLWVHPDHLEWDRTAGSPGAWFVACVLIWPVFVPGYLCDRKYAFRRTVGHAHAPPRGA